MVELRPVRWGGYTGDEGGGELEVEGTPGDIIRWGQKDGRGNHGVNAWIVIIGLNAYIKNA